MTREELDKIMEYANAATDGEWVYGKSPVSGVEAMIGYVSDLIVKSPGETLHLVCRLKPENPDESPIIAVTGNGKQSAENATFLTLAKQAIPMLVEQICTLHAARDRDRHLLGAVQDAYRKHVQGDEGIGWLELGDTLMTALCESMGDDGFQAWLDERRQEPVNG